MCSLRETRDKISGAGKLQRGWGLVGSSFDVHRPLNLLWNPIGYDGIGKWLFMVCTCKDLTFATYQGCTCLFVAYVDNHPL